ncbi:glycosyltransferase family 61 protein [Halonotius sp. GCM10025705]|uniref:glycosyltransferase family 61 protein n=1 Tax=Halonotius sp. GCM10025705 TaxID=3252678 RepID=UPI0036075ADC
MGITAADLFVRKRIGRRVFDPVVERNIVRTLSREELTNNAIKLVELPDGTADESSPFVSQIDSGYVLSETGLLTTQAFEIIEESAAPPEHAQQAMMAMCSRELFFGYLPIRGLLTGKSSANLKVLDTVAPLIPRYPTNYYHWMVETVPKVRYLHEFEAKTGTEVTVLIPSGRPPFIDETLNLLNWPESKIILSSNPIYKTQNLVVPSFPERTAADFDWLHNEILGSISTEDEPTDQRNRNNVYVSRANAIERRVLNEEEVMSVLSDYGFERYCLENRALAENIRLFNQADIVVGPHGAGLTDIIFAEDCTLMELFGEKVKQPYRVLADTLDIEYEPMYCTAESADIVVDTDELEEQVSALVE